ncbi:MULTISPECIES: GNAT family N-acetyltransferase [Bacillus]|uniref:N-acetyltransferase n=1 Tax=Bacillus pseudomycoides TaxID=64104 RepID=A0A1Y3MI59_9BACI|nr:MULTISPECIES: GNAT family N-acetyltransferase [Bacillus cereus group]EOQ08502.1 acetyltransferase [Bacillus cereus VDM021]MDF2085380.1 GNAT family N-acetyltransferase [Bacillus pseudomycoides]OUM50125.1 N-acetyltransferase [Bacillus pseudomycoides]
MNLQTEDIQLIPYDEKYKEIIDAFILPSEQIQFTAKPSDLLEKAKKDTTRNVVVILANHTPVGIFALQSGTRVAEYTDNPNALLLVAFSINYEKQGKGYAKKGLALLHDFVASYFPNKNEIVLAVNEKNITAQKLYLKVGFEDRGQRRMGPIGRQLVLYLSLEK